ncbi:MAG: hypothetical protein AAF411_01520 [Myxococcota bacterium]
MLQEAGLQWCRGRKASGLIVLMLGAGCGYLGVEEGLDVNAGRDAAALVDGARADGGRDDEADAAAGDPPPDFRAADAPTDGVEPGADARIDDLGVDIVVDAVADGSATSLVFDDDFEDDSLDDWLRLHVVEGRAAQYTLLDVNSTVPGALVIEPTRTPGWFENGDAPLIYREVNGNFAIEANVEAFAAGGVGRPSSNFNSVGVMVREPADPVSAENHVMVNLGRQNSSGIGSESKNTTDGRSRLTTAAGEAAGHVLLCRVGPTLRTYVRYVGMPWVLLQEYERPDLPDALQAGMVANGFSGPDLRAVVYEVGIREVNALDGCLDGADGG